MYITACSEMIWFLFLACIDLRCFLFSTFSGNVGTSGVLGVWFVFANFTGANWFIRNTGNALQASSWYHNRYVHSRKWLPFHLSMFTVSLEMCEYGGVSQGHDCNEWAIHSDVCEYYIWSCMHIMCSSMSFRLSPFWQSCCCSMSFKPNWFEYVHGRMCAIN